MWTPPDGETLHETIGTTWPAAEMLCAGPFTLRRGDGGGQRVSAATLNGAFTQADIDRAAVGMRALGQPALFMIRAGDEALDEALHGLGYQIKDPTLILAASAALMARQDPGDYSVIRSPARIAIIEDVWATGHYGAGRFAVMDRVTGRKTYLLGRHDDHPAAVALVALHEQTAMLHGLEVMPKARRRGLGARMTAAAAAWAAELGATTLSLLVVRENKAAIALYHALGMEIVGQYHYRVLPE